MTAATPAMEGPPHGGPSTSASQAAAPGPGSGFQLSLPGFAGTLELLLQLVERARLDIAAISLARVAEQCLAHLRAEQDRRPLELADFIGIGSRLLLLKSRCLLPAPALAPQADEPRASEDAGDEELRRAAQGCLPYRIASGGFRLREQNRQRCFPRCVAPPLLPPQLPAESVPVDQLAALLRRALQRTSVMSAPVLPAEIVSVSEKLQQLRAALQVAERVSFLGLASTCATRLEIVVCFIAVLHLLCEGTAEAIQEEPFGDILLTRAAA